MICRYFQVGKHLVLRSTFTRWWFKDVLIFYPDFSRKWSYVTGIFSKRLVQPPAKIRIFVVYDLPSLALLRTALLRTSHPRAMYERALGHLMLTSHMPGIYADIKFDAQYWRHQLVRSRPYSCFLKRRPIPTYEQVLRFHYAPLPEKSALATKRYDSWFIQQVVESWTMRTYHGLVDVFSRLTALYPIIEPAYRARGGAVPTTRLAAWSCDLPHAKASNTWRLFPDVRFISLWTRPRTWLLLAYAWEVPGWAHWVI